MVLFPLGYDVFNGFKFRRHSNRDTMYMFHTNTYDDIIAKTDLLQSRRRYCVVTTELNRKLNSATDCYCPSPSLRAMHYGVTGVTAQPIADSLVIILVRVA